MSYATRCHVTAGRVGVEDEVARSRVAIARLADAARVEQHAPAGERQGVDPLSGATTSMPPVVLGERDRDMGVPVQPVASCRGRARFARATAPRRDVLAQRVARAAVDQRDVTDRRAASGRAASQARVDGRDRVARSTPTAARASGLNQSISGPPRAAAS